MGRGETLHARPSLTLSQHYRPEDLRPAVPPTNTGSTQAQCVQLLSEKRRCAGTGDLAWEPPGSVGRLGPPLGTFLGERQHSEG